MAYTPQQIYRLTSEKDLSVDTNSTASVSTATDVENSQRATLYVTGDTGTHVVHVVTVQVSPDGVNFFETTYSVTGEGFKEFDCTALKTVRAKVTRAEGGRSTCTITIDSFG